MMIDFFLPMQPPTATHQEKKVMVRNGKPIFYEPEEVLDARNKFEAYLAPYAPKYPMVSPIQLLTKWCYPRVGKHRNGEYKTSKPDTDNMIKLFKDCMTKVGFWKDDAGVSSEITEKFWADVPGIYVRVTELPEHTEAGA